MKVSKKVLKDLIKECLVEILVEGLDSSDGNQLREAIRRPTPTQLNAPVRPIQPRPKPALAAAVTETAKGDNILADVLADTAATTFQTQRENELPDPSAGATMLTEAVGPQHKENDSIESPWAKLAFDSPKADTAKLAHMGFKVSN